MAPECPLEKASGLIMVKVRLLIFSFLLGGKCRDNVWHLPFNSAPLPAFGLPLAVVTRGRPGWGRISMRPITEIYPLLKQPRRVVIIMHQKPDADAMGSSLGLSLFLRKLGHQTTVISPTNWAEWLKWMPDAGAVLDYEFAPARAQAVLDQAEWVFCLDFNPLTRTRHMSAPLRKLGAIKLLIDHHQEPDTAVFAY